jgi:Apea-like HEPN
MADYYALTKTPLPPTLHGADADFSIRTLSDQERLSIEDHFFNKKDVEISLSNETTAVIIPSSRTSNATMEDFAVLVEFALGILAVSGFQPITIVSTINASNCVGALTRSYQEKTIVPAFPRKLVKSAASTWMRHFFEARRKPKDKLHITADRFVRYLRMNNSRDALVDLCICLETLFEMENEISFRFAVCLAKVARLKDCETTSGLLTDLYSLRSKVVHGADYSKAHRKVVPNTAQLRSAARAILTAYVFFLSEHSREDWNKHLKRSVFT